MKKKFALGATINEGVVSVGDDAFEKSRKAALEEQKDLKKKLNKKIVS